MPPNPLPTAAEIRRMDTAALEDVYAHSEPIALPKGRLWGRVLARLDNPGANRPFWRASQKLGFEWLPFGIDFDRRLWFFSDPRIAIGRFRATIEPSRWRPTQAVTLRYDVSRLPSFVRRSLYDEVKPLGPDLALGLGGIDAGPGEGDHFFFLLERLLTG